MARRKITIDTLPAEVKRIVNKYTDDMAHNVREAARETASKGRTALARKSIMFDNPPNKGRWGHGVYSSGWRVHEVEKKYGWSEVIHNEHQPFLTHLLENGHELNIGGRARAFPHIEPVAEKLPEDFSEEIIKRIKGI